VYNSNNGVLLALLLPAMQASEKNTDAIVLKHFLGPDFSGHKEETVRIIKARVRQKLVRIQLLWDEFAAVVSPWLSDRITKVNELDKATAIARRDLDAVLAGTQQLLLGAAHMNERGMMHADIKPPNAMLHHGVWTLIDLGLSCAHKRSWTSNECACVWPEGACKLKASWDCFESKNIKPSINIACNRWGVRGSPVYLSPGQLPAQRAVWPDSDIKNIWIGPDKKRPAARFCVFNRRACTDSVISEEFFSGNDAFSIGMMLLQFLAGAGEDIFDQDIGVYLSL
jgi:serine/threonine protein kinase